MTSEARPSAARTAAHYLFALAAVSAMLLLRQRFGVAFGTRPMLLLFVLPVILSAYLGGLGPGLAATAAAGLSTNYFLIPPVESLRISESHDLLQWGLLWVDGLLISILIGRLRGTRRRLDHSVHSLQTTEAQQRQLLDHIATAVVVHAPDTRITYSNPVAARILGLTAEQMQGKQAIDPAWRFLQERGDAMALPDYPVNRVLATRQPLRDYIVGVQVPGRPQPTWVLVNAYPDHTPDGALQQVVVNFTDVTPMRQMEAQLAQARKMEAVGQLAGGIAHDFNNILQAVRGFADLARGDLDPGHPAATSVDEIAKAGDRAAKLVDQLLAFGRRQLLDPANLDLNQEVGGLLGLLERLIGEHIQVDFIPGHHLGVVRADRTMMEQVLINLCVNARDAMPRGGRLTIELENITCDRAFCTQNPWARPGRYVLLSVTDTGHGMDAATLERVFEPFFTTKEPGRGTGLGLATVYGIVRQHEGMARAYSEPGKGTTFKVYLPSVERPADEVGTKIEGPPRGGRETILVAEDDPGVREAARRTLERAGYTVWCARDGAEALEVFRAHAAEIQLLLLDVVMPELGGKEVSLRIRETHPALPILFASGYSENAVHTNFVLQEGIKLLRKPYQTAALLAAVREELDAVAARGG